MSSIKNAMWAEGESPFGAFFQTLKEMFDSLLTTAPMVVIWLVLLALGWVIFKFVTRAVGRVLEKAGVDGIAERLGVTSVLSKFGIKGGFSASIGKVLFALLMIQFTMISADKFGLDWLTQPLGSIVAFLPRAITAFIIMIVGYIVADLVRNALLRGAENLGLDYSRALSNLAFGFLLLLVIILAIRELGVETSLLEDCVKIAMVGISLALAIALGLGLHQLTRNIVSGVYARDLYQSGSQIDFDGELTTVVGVGSVTTKLQKTDGSFVMIPNTHVVGEITRGRDAS